MNKRIKWMQTATFLIIMALLAGSLNLGANAAPAKAHPALLELAEHAPEMQVSVIVQKASPDREAESLAEKLGGVVTKNLSIINAFAAKMSAQAARKLAASPLVRWVSLDAAVQSSGGEATFTTWATAIGAEETMDLYNGLNLVDSGLGPNGTYAIGINGRKGSVTGFQPEATPGNAITKVEILLNGYVPGWISHDFLVKVWLGGIPIKEYPVWKGLWYPHIKAENAGQVVIDVTNARAWNWADLENSLAISLHFWPFDWRDSLALDSIGIRVTSNAGSDITADTYGDTSALTTIDTSQQNNVFNQVIRSSDLWNTSSRLQGRHVTVAVVDSGVFRTRDLGRRVRTNVNFNPAYHDAADRYGHGTFVAGVIAGNGSQSAKKYIGVAPRADLLSLRVSDDQGASSESDVVSALQWVLENKDEYNIRVVNLSLNSSMSQSYQTSPLCAAVEILWFNGIVVVVAAGNNGSATLFPPANDPFVITVGATADNGTLSMSDDVVATFSAYGTTEDGFAKPDLVAPGKNIIGLLPDNDRLKMSSAHSENRIDKNYFKMSGTSVSAPMVSGSVALLLQDEPNLTPDQVKYRLMATANKNWPGYNTTTAGAGYLDIFAAVYSNTTESANTGISASQLLWTGSEPVTWGSVAWNSVAWNSVAWNSVAWNSVAWNSVAWNSDYWGP